MSHIDELIEELCPNGVEHRPLREVGTLVRGNGMPKSDFTADGMGAIHYGQIYTHYGAWTETTISFVSQETASRLAVVDPGDTIITNTSENLEDVGKAVAWLGAEQIVTGGHATVLKHDEDPKFLSYWFQTPAFYDQKRRLATGTKVIDVSAANLAKIRIPVPPLEVQQEIVRILDKFTALEADLEAELEARRKQYEHYRAEAFRRLASDSSKWMTLGAVCDRVSTGATPRAGESSFYEAGDVPWLRTNEVVFRDIWDTELRVTERALSETGISLISKDCVIVAISGATAGRSAVNRIPLTTNQHCCNLQVDSSVAYFRYVYHWVRFQYEALKARGRGPRKDLNVRLICEHPIPVPPLDEQRRIADILDKFDALVNDLSVGLPAELAARRKQYEYYRDRLLTFKELAE